MLCDKLVRLCRPLDDISLEQCVAARKVMSREYAAGRGVGRELDQRVTADCWIDIENRGVWLLIEAIQAARPARN